MAKVPEMNSDFAQWYTETFMDEGTTRAARWKGVVDTAAKSTFEHIEVLVRLAFATSTPANGLKNENMQEHFNFVVSTIAGGDATFVPEKSARELQVLAAAVLVRLLPTTPDAALSVTTAAFNGARRPELPMDLVGLAEAALPALSKRNHTRPELEELEVAESKLEFKVSAEGLGSFVAAQWKIELERLRDSVVNALSAATEEQNRVVQLLSGRTILAEEELQMLWWLVGGYSTLLDMPLSKIGTNLKPFIFAKELGEMVNISPGPASIIAMFSRAGVGDKGLKIRDAINAVDDAQAKEFSQTNRISPLTTPLHFALEKRSEVGSADAWQASWAAMTGLSVTDSLPAIKLAELFYREHLYLHVSG